MIRQAGERYLYPLRTVIRPIAAVDRPELDCAMMIGWSWLAPVLVGPS
jgi:hypothetical protein